MIKDISSTSSVALSVRICAMLAYFGAMVFVSSYRAIAMSIGV